MVTFKSFYEKKEKVKLRHLDFGKGQFLGKGQLLGVSF